MPRAIETYRLGLERLANNPVERSKLELNIGSVYFTLGDLDAAIAHFRIAIAADPRSPRAHSNLGLALATTVASRGDRRAPDRNPPSPDDTEIRNQLRRVRTHRSSRLVMAHSDPKLIHSDRVALPPTHTIVTGPPLRR